MAKGKTITTVDADSSPSGVKKEVSPIDKLKIELIEVRKQLNSKPKENDRTALLARQTYLQGKI
tara:strand:+ start:825 stop:1016 length:192 start_codon:yes stop_codon:yes gene_type:complete